MKTQHVCLARCRQESKWGSALADPRKKEREKMYVKKRFALYENTIQNICEKDMAKT